MPVDYAALAQQARDAAPAPAPVDYAALAQQARGGAAPAPPPVDYAALAQQARESAPASKVDYAALAQQARASAPSRPQPEGVLEGIGKDLSIGWRTGVADVAHTVSNVLDKTPFSDLAQKARQFADDEAPKPEETVDRGGFGNALAQGVGGVIPAAVKYAPAMVAKKWAPLSLASSTRRVPPTRDWSPHWKQGRRARYRSRSQGRRENCRRGYNERWARRRRWASLR